MTSKERVLKREKTRAIPVGMVQGKADALDLGQRAPNMDGTAIIDEESKIPQWSEHGVYPAGVAVKDKGQVYTLLVPHRAADNPGVRPFNLRSIYDLRHTKDPKKATYWMASLGISGIWRIDECCTYINPADNLLHVYRNNYENNEFPPHTLNVEERWTDLGLAIEAQKTEGEE